ncbi:MAG TPA: hypothetical protein VNF73_06875 [Candidatus Saccharimonadales bacterium]|nr:hypothetical protein [Candidatus Saccharimonadales bacterium]
MTTKALRLVLVVACAAILVGCGGSSGSASPSSAPPTTAASANPSLIPSTEPSAPPSSATNASPAASGAPSATVVTDLTNIVGPQTAFRGPAGTFHWTNVELKIARTIVRWSATASSSPCTFSWKLSGKATASGATTVAANAKTGGNVQISGTSGPDQLLVASTCKSWLLTFNQH